MRIEQSEPSLSPTMNLLANIIPAQELQALEHLIQECERIVVFPHTAPDGDALGSIIGWSNTLSDKYPEKKITMISPDSLERYLQWIKGVETIIIYPEETEKALETIAEADLLFHLDHNQVSRLRYQPLIDAVRESGAKKVLIDHHLYPETSFNLQFSYPDTSSTCELVYCIIKGLGYTQHISADTATALTTGIITDTGRFMYGCFEPALYTHFSELLALGADYPHIIDRLSYHGTLAELKLKGYILHEKLEIYEGLGAAIISLTQEEMETRQISKGDTEGLVNLPLSVEGIDCVCFIREDKSQIKISLRSIGQFPVNEIASTAFGGGGHLNAAGGEHQGSISTARELFIDTLKALRAKKQTTY